MHGMNPNGTLPPAPEDDAIDAMAGNYVLGTLSADERREVESWMAREPRMRAAVDAWDKRLHPLVTLAEPVEPSAALWQRIEASLAPATATRNAAAAPRRRSGWLHSVTLWRGVAGASFAMAAFMAAVLVGRPPAAPPTQFVVVLVAPQDKAPGWVVQTAEGARQLSLIPLGSVTVPGDKALQFWTKADSWNSPVSLGLVTPGQTLQVPLEKLPPLEANQLFELTLEPATGSPTGRPTGPIQFIGRAVKVL
jgi:anti-sigma-K factor RskA